MKLGADVQPTAEAFHYYQLDSYASGFSLDCGLIQSSVIVSHFH